MFYFVRKCQTVFQSGRTMLRSRQQCNRVPVAPHRQPHLMTSVLWILGILTAGWWCLIFLLSECPDDMNCGAPFHVLICHLCIVSGEVSAKVLGPYLIRLFWFFIMEILEFLYILRQQSLSDMPFANIFPHKSIL